MQIEKERKKKQIYRQQRKKIATAITAAHTSKLAELSSKWRTLLPFIRETHSKQVVIYLFLSFDFAANHRTKFHVIFPLIGQLLCTRFRWYIFFRFQIQEETQHAKLCCFFGSLFFFDTKTIDFHLRYITRRIATACRWARKIIKFQIDGKTVKQKVRANIERNIHNIYIYI